MSDLVPGERLGDYTLLRRLGRGASASVFAARHDAGFERALKVQTVASPALRARFEREAATLAKLRHPGIVRIHEVQQHGARSVLVLDLVEGPDLRSVVAERGALPLDEALDLTAQLAQALGAIHALALIHRDVKPANVLVGPDGRALLTDFGLARDPERSRLTATGALVGTPRHMAPEQLDPRLGAVTAQADVFALGTVLHELATGAPAFDGRSLPEVLAAVARGEPPRPSDADPTLPRALDALVLRCLARDPAERPTADAVADACAALRRGEPSTLVPISGWRRLWRRARRGETAPLLALSGLVGSLLLCVGLWGAERVFLAPRRAALEAVRAHQAWRVGTLTPYELSLAGAATPAAPPDPAALAAADASLAAAEPWLAPEARQRVAAWRADLRAHLRAREGRAPARAAGSAGLLAAIAAAARRPAEAYAALPRPGASTPAEALLALRLAAELLHPDLPARALAIEPGTPAHELAAALAAEPLQAYVAARATWRELAGPGALRASLDAAQRASAHLGLPPAPLRAARAAALAEQAPGWGQALTAAVADGEELVTLARLAAVLEGGHPIPPPPALRAALDAGLDALAARFDAARRAGDHGASQEAARRLFALHDRIVWTIAPDFPIARFQSLGLLLQRGQATLPLEVVLGCLRAGAYRGISSLVQRTDPQALADYLARHPTSRAARLLALEPEFRAANGEPELRAAVVAQLESIRTTGPPALAPGYQGLLDVYAARLLVQDAREAGACSAAQAAAIRARTQRARDQLEQLDRAAETFEHEAELATIQGDAAAAEAAWAAAADWFAALPAGLYRDFYLARALSQRGLAEAQRGDLAAAEASCRQAVEQVRGTQRTHGGVHAALSQVLRARGLVDAALEALAPHVERNAHDPDFMAELIAVQLARGARGEAQAAYRLALEALAQRNRAPSEALLRVGAALREADSR